FREKPSDKTAQRVWLKDNRQKQLLTMQCDYGLCVYEKNGFKVGVANTKIGAYDACEMKDLDILFITTTFNEKCLAKRRFNRDEISEAGVYMLTLTLKKTVIKTVSEDKGFRPWSPSYPVISLTDGLNAFR
ncbi:MAG: hypothetical protein IKR09_07850, partial [Alphaproteobacteria bacterium]|nr:hypothetical protein [Alphaproteobacteria bacterium]